MTEQAGDQTVSGHSGRIRKRLVAALAGVGMAAALSVASAPPAHAWYRGQSWIVVSNANCVGGGKIIGVWGAVDNMWSGGDWGDNVLYVTSRIGDVNTFNGRAFCDRPWYDPRGDYYINVVWKQFRPTANNQTFWF
jgi:hypothetical protein